MTEIDIKQIVLNALEEKKAENISVIDLNGKTTLADYMIFANGRSSKNVAAIAEFVAQELKDRTNLSIGLDGMRNSEWVIVDAGSVMLHLFHPQAREHYKLEEVWQ